MPLITCPDCEKRYSDAAPACIHCGRPTMSAAIDPISEPMAQNVRAGVQSSKRRQDVGSAIAFVGLPVAMVIGMATSATAGWTVAVAVCVLAVIVHYR